MYGNVNPSNTYIFLRSYNNDNSNGGVSYLNYNNSNNNNSNRGSRLAKWIQLLLNILIHVSRLVVNLYLDMGDEPCLLAKYVLNLVLDIISKIH